MGGDIANWIKAFANLPVRPVMSLRGGNAADDSEPVPSYEPALDTVTPVYLETYFFGLAQLDSASWRFYLPHFLSYALENVGNTASNAIESFLFSLRPPDRDPPRFGALSYEQRQAVVSVLDQLAFSDHSAWKEPAIIALEEYWAPGATYR